MTRLLIVDDHAAFRQPLALLMNREPGFVVVAQAGTLGEARQKLDGIDIALIDRDLPDGDGASLAETLRARNPGTRVLLLTGLEISSQAPGGTTLVAQTLDKSATLNDILGTTRSLVAG